MKKVKIFPAGLPKTSYVASVVRLVIGDVSLWDTPLFVNYPQPPVLFKVECPKVTRPLNPAVCERGLFIDFYRWLCYFMPK